jgi:uncharacterized membrane protein (UPF0127 family)
MTHVKPRAGLLRRALLLLSIALAAGGPSAAQTGPQPKLRTVELRAGMHLIQAELAVSPTEQATGMMFRTSMGTNEGMLFVVDEPELRCFWMKNTLLPLSIAFIADDGTIVNLADMQPRSEQSHCSARKVRYALEMNQGWFAKRGIGPGSKIAGPMFKPK